MTTVAVVGLGYVGLPRAVEFGKKWRTIGFDLSASKIANYRKFIDPTGEVSEEELRARGCLICWFGCSVPMAASGLPTRIAPAWRGFCQPERRAACVRSVTL